MKKMILSAGAVLLAGAVLAADSSPKDDVLAAAKKLEAAPNYSWKLTTVVPESSPFKPGPTEGKLEKGGVTYFTLNFGENTTKIYLQGASSAVNTPDGNWRSASELEGEEGPGRFIGFIVRSSKTPAVQAQDLLTTVPELKPEGDALAGEMTEDGAKSQFRFGSVTHSKGTVKFWLKDGQLTKFEFRLTGKAEFNGNEFDVDRDTTLQITDVGTTKLEVPAEAKQKLAASPAPAAATNAPAAK